MSAVPPQADAGFLVSWVVVYNDGETFVAWAVDAAGAAKEAAEKGWHRHEKPLAVLRRKSLSKIPL